MFFDATTVDTSAAEVSFKPIPDGDYLVTVESAEEKPTSKGGKYVKVVFEVLGGSYSRKKIFQNFNIENSNAQAQMIGRAQFATLCIAAELPRLQMPSQLVGRVVCVSVTTEKRKDNGEEQNKITKFKNKSEKANTPDPGPNKVF